MHNQTNNGRFRHSLIMPHPLTEMHRLIVKTATKEGIWYNSWIEDGVAQLVEHWTANLAAWVRSLVGEEPSDLMCAFLHVQMESNWAWLSVCNCQHTSKLCGTIKTVGNTDHTRQTWTHMQTPLSPLAGCGPVGEGTSGKVLNWTARSLNHLHHYHQFLNTTEHGPYSLTSDMFTGRCGQVVSRWGTNVSDGGRI